MTSQNFTEAGVELRVRSQNEFKQALQDAGRLAVGLGAIMALQLGGGFGVAAAGAIALTGVTLSLGVAVLGLTAGLAGLTAVLSNSLSAAIDFEAAMVGIQRTMEPSSIGFEAVSNTIRDLAKQIPFTTTQLAEIGTEAGRMGIRANDAGVFIAAMADVLTTSTFTTDQAVRAYARLGGIMELPISEITKLTGAVTELDNSTRTSEQEIVQFSLRMAAAGKQAGLTAADVVGIAATFRELDVRAERGGTAVSVALDKIGIAVAENSDDLKVFAAVAGLTVDEFSRLWERDAAMAFDKFVSGLNTSADKAVGALQAVGLGAQRWSQALRTVAEEPGRLARNLDIARKAFEEGNATQREAARVYATTASGIQVLKNRFHDLFIEVGNSLLPSLRELLNFLDDQVLPALSRLAQSFSAAASGAIAGVKEIYNFNNASLDASGAADTLDASLQDIIVNAARMTVHIEKSVKTFGIFIDILGTTANQAKLLAQALINTIGGALGTLGTLIGRVGPALIAFVTRDIVGLAKAMPGLVGIGDDLKRSWTDLGNTIVDMSANMQHATTIQGQFAALEEEYAAKLDLVTAAAERTAAAHSQERRARAEASKFVNSSISELTEEIEQRQASIREMERVLGPIAKTTDAYQKQNTVIALLDDHLRAAIRAQAQMNDQFGSGEESAADFGDAIDDVGRKVGSTSKALKEGAQFIQLWGAEMDRAVGKALAAHDAFVAWESVMQELAGAGHLGFVAEQFQLLGDSAEQAIEKTIALVLKFREEEKRLAEEDLAFINERNRLRFEAMKATEQFMEDQAKELADIIKRQWDAIADRRKQELEDYDQFLAEYEARLLHTANITKIATDLMAKGIDIGDAISVNMTWLDAYKTATELENAAIRDSWSQTTQAIDDAFQARVRSHQIAQAQEDALRTRRGAAVVSSGQQLVQLSTKGVFDPAAGGFRAASLEGLLAAAGSLGGALAEAGGSLSNLPNLVSGIEDLPPDLLRAIAAGFNRALIDIERDENEQEAEFQARRAAIPSTGVTRDLAFAQPVSPTSTLQSLANGTTITVNANYTETQSPVTIKQDIEAVALAGLV